MKNYANHVNKIQNEVTDICTILKKCSIDEISKYLIDREKEKFSRYKIKIKFLYEKNKYRNNWFRQYWKLFI